MDGVINIYKERGYTSHDVVAIVRKLFHSGELRYDNNKNNKQKVGHTGTLDPEAEGVLPICLGRATKLCDYITAEKKQYVCECILGKATDTQDFTGNVIFENTPKASENEIKEVIMTFVGKYEQIPPMYSAIKQSGKKLYTLAREGITVERKKRPVYIHDINIIEINLPNKIKFSVDCSKGTYIRTLCHDIGEKLGCGGYMNSLLRTMSGRFCIDNAVKLDKLAEIYENRRIDEVIIPIEDVLSIYKKYKKVVVDVKSEKQLYNGNPIKFDNICIKTEIGTDDILATYSADDKLVGLYKPDFNKSAIKPVTMLI